MSGFVDHRNRTPGNRNETSCYRCCRPRHGDRGAGSRARHQWQLQTDNFDDQGQFSAEQRHDQRHGLGGGAGLAFLDTPGSADGNIYLAVYGPFDKTSPDGGNFVEADAAPSYANAITQTINSLTIGQDYTLNFYQAAGQQKNFKGPTTERWKVSFGAGSQLSSMYSLSQRGVGAWQSQTMTFTAHATSQLLSFLAVGTPDGQPPISFLDGVSLQAAIPEPATWALLMTGFAMVGVAARRRNSAAVAA